jgi:hypothetical protein
MNPRKVASQQCVHWTAGTHRVFRHFSERKAVPVSELGSRPAASNAKPLGAHTMNTDDKILYIKQSLAKLKALDKSYSVFGSSSH